MICWIQLRFKWVNEHGKTEQELPIWGESCEEAKAKAWAEVKKMQDDADRFNYKEFKYEVGTCNCSPSP